MLLEIRWVADSGASRVVCFSAIVAVLVASFSCSALGITGTQQEGAKRTWRDWERFEIEFLTYGPAEQARVFKKGTYAKYVEDVLVGRGVDVVPYLVAIVKDQKEPIFQRWRAMRILCDMDRFVPVEQLPLPRMGIYIRPLKWGGQIDTFVPITGRRIGSEAFGTLVWAAEQNRDKDLRFHARDLLGLLAKDLEALTLEDKVQRWWVAIHKNKGFLGGVHAPDEYIIAGHLRNQLIEAAPESISLLVGLVETTPSSYVREALITLLAEIDLYRVRLRALPEGQRAIEVVRTMFAKGNLRPVYRNRELRDEGWKYFSTHALQDEWHVHKGSKLMLFAEAAQVFHGDPSFATAPDRMKSFVTYLTETDPFFPSWEFCHTSSYGAGEILHPRFRAKVGRYYAAWKEFQARTAAPTEPPPVAPS